jgi:hypothetical protein
MAELRSASMHCWGKLAISLASAIACFLNKHMQSKKLSIHGEPKHKQEFLQIFQSYKKTPLLFRLLAKTFERTEKQ